MKLTKCFALVALFPILSASGLSAQSADAPDYHFEVPDNPVGATRFAYTLYSHAPKRVFNLIGRPVANLSEEIVNMAISPIGRNCAVVTTDTKGRNSLTIINVTKFNDIVYKFKRKKLGNPTSAVYTPDGQSLVVATDDSIAHILDARKYFEQGTIALKHPAANMTLSKNAYHLATTDGRRVTVYNFEDKNVRHSWDFETGVTGMVFSDDDTELAIATDDGQVSIYDTRTFIIKNTLEDVGDALAVSYNFDGKYMAVAQSPESIVVVNLLEPETDRMVLRVPAGDVRDLVFIPDTKKNTLLAYTTRKAVDLKRMEHLQPYYNKLVNDEVSRLMNEWLKRMPDESLEDYRARVNDETRARQRRLFEDEVATRMAPDMLAMAEVTLGQYDKRHELLEVNFSNMPSIYLPVKNDDIEYFVSAGDLTFTNARYSVDNSDRFEMIYAEVLNSADGKTYIYNNIERAELSFMTDDDDEEEVSLALIEQQQMEEIRLREIQEEVVAEAKSQNVISDHTNINVSSEVVPDYDANGNRILNYKVSYTYEVDPGFTAKEDFGPGKYHINESGAASSMLEIVRKSLEGELARYVKEGKKVNVRISGTADSSPIVGKIIYDGVYGEFDEEPIYNNGELTTVTVTPKGRRTETEQRAFLRAQGVKKYLEDNIKELHQMKSNSRIDINVTEGKGSQFRRINAEITFVDAV
ncbi:MAG: WD40 repeat domain-containing protein [Muribaculaceae bacterium]|nr:WD40 repeat domain-containing protein [Muribaculaceae bacterium]